METIIKPINRVAGPRRKGGPKGTASSALFLYSDAWNLMHALQRDPWVPLEPKTAGMILNQSLQGGRFQGPICLVAYGLKPSIKGASQDQGMRHAGPTQRTPGEASSVTIL